MKDSLATGLAKTRRITVDRARTIGLLGDDARVYATPAMIADIETLAHDLVLEHLDAGEETVGTRIEIDHRAPTPEGMWIELTVEIVELDGRAATLSVSGRDALDEICRGRHGRFVVDIAKTRARLAAKAAKAGA